MASAKFFLTLFLLLITSLNTWAQVPHHCEALFGPAPAQIKQYEFSDWHRVYAAARLENNTKKAALALVYMAIAKQRELNAAGIGKNALVDPKNYKFFAQTLNQESLNEADDNFYDLLENQVSKSERFKKKFKKGFMHVLWSQLPFAFRSAHNIYTRYQVAYDVSSTLFNILSDPYLVDQFFTIDVQDSFLNEVKQEWFSTKGAKSMVAAIKAQQKGNFWYPLILSGFIFSDLGLHLPERLSHQLESNQLPQISSDAYLQAVYLGTYLENGEAKNYKDQKITVILDKTLISKTGANFIREALFSKINVYNIDIIKDLKAMSPQTQVIGVDNFNELNLALTKSQNSDLVIIFAHGEPGNFALGSNEQNLVDHIDDITAPRLKPGANLIYFSCDLANQYIGSSQKQNPAWTRLADKVLDHGLAFAPTTPVQFSFDFKIDGIDYKNPSLFDQFLREYFARGLKVANRFADFKYYALYGPYYDIKGYINRTRYKFHSPGIGIYSTEQKKVQYLFLDGLK